MRHPIRIALCIIVFFPWCAFGQNVPAIQDDYLQNKTPKTPETSSFGSFGSVPVNYYTGLPEISLPLLSLESRELSIPISINYDATGVRTEEFASPVGLKWNLNAGGSITRNMNGIPDETPDIGYFNLAKETDYYDDIDAGAYDEWVYLIQRKEHDSGPDEFIINLPNRSLKFVFDKHTNAITVPRENVVIKRTLVGNKLNKFELITEDGTKYIFGGVASTIEERKIESFSMSLGMFYQTLEGSGSTYFAGTGPFGITAKPGQDFFFNLNFSKTEKSIPYYNSKWYLVSITSPSGDHIDFGYTKSSNESKFVTKPVAFRAFPVLGTIGGSYTNGSFTYPDPLNPLPRPIFVIRKFGKTEPGSPVNTDHEIVYQATDQTKFFDPTDMRANPGVAIVNQNLITESIIKIISITAANGNHISFTAPFDRLDLPNAFKYERVDLYNYNNQQVKSIKFNFSYLNANEDNDYMWASEAVMLGHISPLSQTGNLQAKHIRALTASQIPDAHFLKYIYEGVKGYNYLRLFLESIEQVSTSASDKSIRLYSFEYFERGMLKRRTTPLFDYLGYSLDPMGKEVLNLSTFTNAEMCKAYKPYTGTNSEEVNRKPLRGMLNKIYYPTGGSTELTFLVNKGPMLKLLQDRDENGVVVSEKEIEYLGTQSSSQPYKFSHYEEYNIEDTDDWIKNVVWSSSPENESYLTKGAVAGNSKVKVYNGSYNNHKGFEVYQYTSNLDAFSLPAGDECCFKNSSGEDFLEFKDERNIIYAEPVDVNKDGEFYYSGFINSAIDTYIFPYPRDNNKDHLRGLLLNHSVYATGSKLLKKTEHCYKINPDGYTPVVVQGLDGGSYKYLDEMKPDFWHGQSPSAKNRYRYGKYKITSDRVVLTRKKEIIYDPSVSDTSANITTYTYLTYDPVNWQVIQSTSFNRLTPTEKIISKTKFVTDASYNASATGAVDCRQILNNCMAGCNTAVNPDCPSQCVDQYSVCDDSPGTTATPEAGAIMLMRSNHQISQPVDIQNWLETNGQLNLLSSVVNKFQKYTSTVDYVKPKEVWMINQPLLPCVGGCDATEFEDSKINTSGAFQLDAKMRKVHTYNSYHSQTGNILQQTSKDGTLTDYEWDSNFRQVNAVTINAGTSQHKTSFDQKPLVGVNTITDPNGVISYYDYDFFNRLMHTRDYNNKILQRFRYHYISESDQESFTASLNVSGSKITGYGLYFSTEGETRQMGETKYQWDFGDGVSITQSGAGATHAYSAPGSYTVSVTKSNPEYGSASASMNIVIHPAPVVTACIDGPMVVFACSANSPVAGSCTTGSINNSSPTTLKSTASGGCSTLTYKWEIQDASGNWSTFATTQNATAPTGFVNRTAGTYTVRCVVTDTCTNSATSSTLTLTIVGC